VRVQDWGSDSQRRDIQLAMRSACMRANAGSDCHGPRPRPASGAEPASARSARTVTALVRVRGSHYWRALSGSGQRPKFTGHQLQVAAAAKCCQGTPTSESSLGRAGDAWRAHGLAQAGDAWRGARPAGPAGPGPVVVDGSGRSPQLRHSAAGTVALTLKCEARGEYGGSTRVPQWPVSTGRNPPWPLRKT
jgi:hypothetical protein